MKKNRNGQSTTLFKLFSDICVFVINILQTCFRICRTLSRNYQCVRKEITEEELETSDVGEYDEDTSIEGIDMKKFGMLREILNKSQLRL